MSEAESVDSDEEMAGAASKYMPSRLLPPLMACCESVPDVRNLLLEARPPRRSQTQILEMTASRTSLSMTRKMTAMASRMSLLAAVTTYAYPVH